MQNNNFESTTRALLNDGRLTNLYDSDKWEYRVFGGKRRNRCCGRLTGGHGAQKPRYKNHRA